MKQNTTQSADGTRIAWRTIGEERGGEQAVVIIPGSLDDGSTWRRVALQLAPEFTFHIVSRRGMGQSEDHPEYSIEKEYEDVRRVLEATGAQRLIGHSFGGVCSLGAVREYPGLERLVIYEPPLPVKEPVVPEDALLQIEEAAEDEDFDRVVETGLLRVVRLPARWVEKLRERASWQAMVATARTWPREIRALYELEPGVEIYSSIRTRTLLPVGERTPVHHRDAAEALLEVLPDARLEVIPGSAHQGQVDARDHLAELFADFLR